MIHTPKIESSTGKFPDYWWPFRIVCDCGEWEHRLPAVTGRKAKSAMAAAQAAFKLHIGAPVTMSDAYIEGLDDTIEANLGFWRKLWRTIQRLKKRLLG